MISGEPIWSDDESAEKGLRGLNFSMCGREDLASLIEELRAKGEQQCNKVWAKGKIAYRCRTCQLNDSSAICVDCFQAGDHRDHDYGTFAHQICTLSFLPIILTKYSWQKKVIHWF
jgi:hypothetical protein